MHARVGRHPVDRPATKHSNAARSRRHRSAPTPCLAFARNFTADIGLSVKALPTPNQLLLAVAALSAAALVAWPQIDLWFSGLFHSAETGFHLRNAVLVRASYWTFHYLPYWAAPLLLWLLFASWRWGGPGEHGLRRRLVFLVMLLVLGPGLVVNSVFKSEWGRARPATVEQFGGDRRFSAALQRTDQCERNCSFVSGHAAMGFSFMAFTWLFGDRRWLYRGAVIGLLVGFGRILQGGHFLSDVVFSGIVVFASALLCARLLLGYWLPPDDRPTRIPDAVSRR